MKNQYKLNSLTSLIECVNKNRLYDVMDVQEVRAITKALVKMDKDFKVAPTECAIAYLLGVMQGEYNERATHR